MKITFRQSGGFMGMVRGCTVDTTTLAADERSHVEGLVTASTLTASFTRHNEGGRDRWQYEITIEHEAAQVHVVCDDACLPEPARPLVAYLVGCAKPMPL
jgi:hypothetical protein